MTDVDPAPTPRRDGIRRAGLVSAVVAILVAGIAVFATVTSGHDGEAPAQAAPVTTATPATTTAIAPTTTAATSSTTSATTTTTSTTSTTTTTAPLPLQATNPIAPPPDPNGAEPLVEVGSISIPAIGLDSPMFEGIRLTTLNHGPGHWPGAASPGQVGNVVVAGHRTSHNAEFRRIDRLVPGDIVTFTTPDGVFDYSVVGTEIVGPDALWIVDPSDTPTATLFACHPPGSTRQRIVVKLALVEPAA
jgi:sortase A